VFLLQFPRELAELRCQHLAVSAVFGTDFACLWSCRSHHWPPLHWVCLDSMPPRRAGLMPVAAPASMGKLGHFRAKSELSPRSAVAGSRRRLRTSGGGSTPPRSAGKNNA